jgi:hypothetical protein
MPTIGSIKLAIVLQSSLHLGGYVPIEMMIMCFEVIT